MRVEGHGCQLSDPGEQLSAHNYVRAVMDAFGAAVRAQDIEKVLSLSTDDVILVGSGREEVGIGRDDVTRFLTSLFSELPPITWDWDDWEIRDGGSHAWFVTEGRVSYGETTSPYRASGVCRRDDLGEWKLAMFHGAAPDD